MPRTGKKPFVIATFIAFALFPLALAAAPTFAWLLLAFVVGGLREIGEPARKALIVDLAEPSLRARVACVALTMPFLVAAGFGAVGVVVFAMTVDEAHAG